MPPLSTRDRITVGLLVFFMLIALTLEAYWLIFHNVMESRTDIFAQIFQLYWPADRTYRIPGYGIEKSLTLALETVNVLVTQWLNIWLIYAIVKRRPYRHALQLTLATYSAYGTFLYLYTGHLSGYAVFESRRPSSYLLFYFINAPWLAGYGWMAYESIRTIARRFRTTAPSS
jgi:emopamil binding protein